MSESNHTREALTARPPQDAPPPPSPARPDDGTAPAAAPAPAAPRAAAPASAAASASAAAAARTHVGWREWVSLPAAQTPWIKAKIDTGARTSALHAFDVQRFERDGADWVRFAVHPWQTSAADTRVVELPVWDVRAVRSSNGVVQERLTARMPLTLAGRTVEAEVTLTSRDEMGFRMLVGRSALEQGFLVDPAASYLGGQPPRGVRRRNRGRA